MTIAVYKELLEKALSDRYDIGRFYLGEEYDIVGISRTKDAFDTVEVCLVSFGLDEDAIKKELDCLPEVALSGLRGFVRGKKSIVLRVFVLEDVTLDLVQTVRSYKYSRAVKGEFWGYSETQVIVVDIKNGAVYSNLAGKDRKKLFVFTDR